MSSASRVIDQHVARASAKRLGGEQAGPHSSQDIVVLTTPGFSLTCRRRHVRCNEAKPICAGCARRKADCVYETQQDQPVPQTPTQARNSPTPATTATNTITAASCSDDDGLNAESDNISDVLGPNYGEDIAAPSATIVPSSLTAPLPEDQPPISTALGPHTRLSQPSVDTTQISLSPIVFEASSESTPRILSPLRPGQSTGGDRSVCHRAIDVMREHQTGQPDSPNVPSPSRNIVYTGLPGFAAGSVSSASHSVETPTARWLELLIRDAVIENGTFPDIDLQYNTLSVFGNSVAQTPTSMIAEDQQTPAFGNETGSQLAMSRTLHASLQERLPQLGSDQVSEKQAWYSIEPIKLSPQECRLFYHFVKHVSQWVS